MPKFAIKTNVKALKNPRGIHERMADLMAEMFKKDRKWLSTQLELGLDMQIGASDAPCAVVEVVDLGTDPTDQERNVRHSAKIAQLLDTELGVPGHRHFIIFSDPGLANVGFNGTTMTAIYAAAGKK